MNSPSDEKIIRYRIDADDVVTFVDPSWFSFAKQNGAPELDQINVVGKPIWSFLANEEVVHLYELLFAAVRSRGEELSVPFRCDSPTNRRYMELRVLPLEDDHLEVVSVLLKEETRPHVDLLASTERDPERILTICSWCKRIFLEPDVWVEVEIAVRKLNLFESPLLPRLSHGLCPDCNTTIMDEISNA